MSLKAKLEYMLKKFPAIAKIAGVKPYPEYDIPEPTEADKECLKQYIADVNAAADRYSKLIDKYMVNPEDTKQQLSETSMAHQDIVAAYEQHAAANQKLQDFCTLHPELWAPGNDVAWFYDADALEAQMKSIESAELPYINELINRCNEIQHQIAKQKDSGANTEDLANELSFTYELILDAQRTIGDRCNEIWWAAIPDVIKHKYAKIMNDSMVKLLAESDELTDYVVNFQDKTADINKCRKFLKLLEQQMNKRLIVTSKPVKCLLAAKHDFKSAGEYDLKEIKIIVGYDYCFKYGINYVIDTVKHEYFGHHVDNVAPNMGLQGESMARFISQRFGKFRSHGGAKTWSLVLQSPLLHTNYDIDDDVPQESLDALRAQGWKLRKANDKFEYSAYRKRFEEQTAFLVGETHDIPNQVLEYRRIHGITSAKKSK